MVCRRAESPSLQRGPRPDPADPGMPPAPVVGAILFRMLRVTQHFLGGSCHDLIKFNEEGQGQA